MRCADCNNWLTEYITIYGDGQKIIVKAAEVGKGKCCILKQDTSPEFGCTSFDKGNTHTIETQKAGAPWQNFHMIACPDCSGQGSSIEKGAGCYRCVGTGKVRKYDDGFIGEERTRLHPKELEKAKPPEIDPGTVLAPKLSNDGVLAS